MGRHRKYPAGITLPVIMNRINGYIERLEKERLNQRADALYILRKIIEPETNPTEKYT
jgi:hypothetical protein